MFARKLVCYYCILLLSHQFHALKMFIISDVNCWQWNMFNVNKVTNFWKAYYFSRHTLYLFNIYTNSQKFKMFLCNRKDLSSLSVLSVYIYVLYSSLVRPPPNTQHHTCMHTHTRAHTYIVPAIPYTTPCSIFTGLILLFEILSCTISTHSHFFSSLQQVNITCFLSTMTSPTQLTYGLSAKNA